MPIKTPLFTLLFIVSFIVCAQTERGWMTTGSNMQVSYFRHDTLYSFDFNLNPNLGYFIGKNIMIGASLGIGLTSDNRAFKGKSRLLVNTSFSPFARYYFLKETVRPFIFARFGYAGSTSIINGKTSNIDGITGGGGVGLNYFFNKQLTLEATLGYTATQMDNQKLRWLLAVGLGVQIFFKPVIPEG